MKIIPTPKLVQPAGDCAKIMKFEPAVEKNIVFQDAVNAFALYVKKIYGISVEERDSAQIRIVQEEMEPEAYRIVICEDDVTLYAGDYQGANHAFASVLQMLQWEENAILLPEVTIQDKPDCSYRGMMVDLARDWHPFSYLLSYVDMCYFYKVAVLQLHFTDDQSYTLPSKLFPKLSTENQSYTSTQIQELVEYANARGVELMPEIDVPGHCKSFGEAYGDLFGTKGVICQHADSIKAMKDLFAELCDMFPYSKYIHIGGDEVFAMNEWTKCPRCLAYAESIGIDPNMEDRNALAHRFYVHFISEMADVCFQKGRQPVVWEGFAKEYNDKLSKDILVMAWESYYQLAPELLEAGFRIVNCSWNPMYIVTPRTMWTPKEVFDWSIYRWQAIHPESPYMETAYECEPNSQIIGGQLLAWGDHILREYPNVIDGVREEKKCIAERLPMLAENTWNITKVTDYESFIK